MSGRDVGSPDRPRDAATGTADPGEGHGSDAASSVAGQVSSSSVSPGGSPKGSASEDSSERDYVRTILDCYLWLPGTATVISRHDRRCARALYRRGVPVGVVKAAMLMAVARRTFRAGGPLPRIRALHFFLPVVDEVLEVPCDPGYVEYLEYKLRPLAAQKGRAGNARLERVSEQVDVPGRGSPHPLREAPSSRGR